MNKDIPPTLGPRERIAQSKGICGKCAGPIQEGEVFRWVGDAAAYPVCERCIKKSNQARGANLRNIR